MVMRRTDDGREEESSHAAVDRGIKCKRNVIRQLCGGSGDALGRVPGVAEVSVNLASDPNG